MNFKDYIEQLKAKYTVRKLSDTEYILHKDRKTLIITPVNMLTDMEIEAKLREKDIDTSINMDADISRNNEDWLGNIGEDDLHPPINRREGHPKGSIFDPKSRNKPMINKSDIYPLKNKKKPDDDHLRKQGGDDDNKFLY